MYEVGQVTQVIFKMFVVCYFVALVRSYPTYSTYDKNTRSCQFIVYLAAPDKS